jgi:hypothetical protein
LMSLCLDSNSDGGILDASEDIYFQ